MTKQAETKVVDATKEPMISAANCPEKESHARRLNQKCGACGEVVPGHNMYTPQEFDKFFRLGPDVSSVPPHPVFESAEMKALTEKQAALWIEHERLRLAYTDALFVVEDLQRGRAGARGRDANGAVGANFDARIAVAKERAETLREGDEAVLRELNRIDQLRKGLHTRALYEESYPPDAPVGSIGARIAAVIRGNT